QPVTAFAAGGLNGPYKVTPVSRVIAGRAVGAVWLTGSVYMPTSEEYLVSCVMKASAVNVRLSPIAYWNAASRPVRLGCTRSLIGRQRGGMKKAPLDLPSPLTST